MSDEVKIILGFVWYVLIFLLLNIKNKDSTFLKYGFMTQTLLCAVVSYLLFVK